MSIFCICICVRVVDRLRCACIIVTERILEEISDIYSYTLYIKIRKCTFFGRLVLTRLLSILLIFFFEKWVSFQFYIFKGFKQYHHSYIRHHSVNIRVNLFNMFLIYNSDYLNKWKMGVQFVVKKSCICAYTAYIYTITMWSIIISISKLI